MDTPQEHIFFTKEQFKKIFYLTIFKSLMNQFLIFIIDENPGIMENTDHNALGLAVI